MHVLPRDIFGFSTFGVAMALLKWLPLKVVDRILILAANSTIGSTDRLGIRRPATGPLELKDTTGKTPVLDVGALSAIKAGKIKVVNQIILVVQFDVYGGVFFFVIIFSGLLTLVSR